MWSLHVYMNDQGLDFFLVDGPLAIHNVDFLLFV